MDKDGYWKIRDSLGSGFRIEPEPQDDENLQFLMVSFESLSRIPEVLNSLGKHGLIGLEADQGKGPSLEPIGQLYGGGPQRPTVYLTFEDTKHPNSNWQSTDQDT